MGSPHSSRRPRGDATTAAARVVESHSDRPSFAPMQPTAGSSADRRVRTDDLTELVDDAVELGGETARMAGEHEVGDGPGVAVQLDGRHLHPSPRLVAISGVVPDDGPQVVDCLREHHSTDAGGSSLEYLDSTPLECRPG